MRFILSFLLTGCLVCIYIYIYIYISCILFSFFGNICSCLFIKKNISNWNSGGGINICSFLVYALA